MHAVLSYFSRGLITLVVELCDMAFQCELMDEPVVAADGHTCEAALHLPHQIFVTFSTGTSAETFIPGYSSTTCPPSPTKCWGTKY